MKNSKKILSLFLASTLATSSFVKCDTSFLSKTPKYLMTGAYSILGVYSGKKTLQQTCELLRILVCIKKINLEYENKDLIAKKAALIIGYLTSVIPIAKIAFFGYLTYFATKNVIEEIKNKDQEETKIISPN